MFSSKNEQILMTTVYLKLISPASLKDLNPLNF